MTPATRYEGGRETAPAEIHGSAMQISELVRANSEAMLQAWTTAMRGMLTRIMHRGWRV